MKPPRSLAAAMTRMPSAARSDRTARARLIGTAMLCSSLFAAEYHVSPSGNDANPGTTERPFRTIQHAADLAQPGDVVTVREGTYRERVNPPRGGTAESNRIVYQAAPGANVVITGSEIIKQWQKVRGDVWKVVIPNAFFNGFNPYTEIIGGEWYATPRDGFDRHTGAVYLNGGWLEEARDLARVLALPQDRPLWFAEVNKERTTITAQFKGVDPKILEGNIQHLGIAEI